MSNVAKFRKFRPGIDVVPEGMVFAIDELTPVPEREPRPVHHIVNTLRVMHVGNSFFYGKAQYEREGLSEMSARANCYQVAKLLGIKVTIWADDDGFRVWRRA